jgi:hypothetical protein
VVKAATGQDGSALAHASERLRAHKPTVLHAVLAPKGFAMRFAAPGLHGDPDVLKAALDAGLHRLD